MTTARVCVDENLTITVDGKLRLAPWAVPRLVKDIVAKSGGDGGMLKEDAMPGKLLIDARTSWRNETPVRHMVLIRVIRRWRKIVTSNPNAIQFRDRWSTGIDVEPEEPVTTGIFNGQVGYAGDMGSNTVAEPNPGVFWYWSGTTMSEQWIGPVDPDALTKLWYRMYVWTPPPWSDNANKNTPTHSAEAGWSRIQLWAYPMQGNLVSG